MSFGQIHSHRRRGAILSMELVMVLPIFLLLIFSIVEFSMLMSARTHVSDTARHGARLLSISGMESEELRQTMRSLLGPKLSSQSQIDIQMHDPAVGIGTVSVSIPMSNAAPDLLWMIGFSLRDRRIETNASMVLERPQTLLARPDY